MWTGYNQLTSAAIGHEIGYDIGFLAGRKYSLRKSGRPVVIHHLPCLGRTSDTVDSEPGMPGSLTVRIEAAARRSHVGRLAPIQECLQVGRGDRGFPGASPKPPHHPVPLCCPGRTRSGNWPAASGRAVCWSEHRTRSFTCLVDRILIKTSPVPGAWRWPVGDKPRSNSIIAAIGVGRRSR